jgi:hypothetical protein
LSENLSLRMPAKVGLAPGWRIWLPGVGFGVKVVVVEPSSPFVSDLLQRTTSLCSSVLKNSSGPRGPVRSTPPGSRLIEPTGCI